ncbi:MAG TPA: ABC transporter permease [Candidatus Limnocylindria bacterium]|nr:ABC transporter permease [Candidatus Limnocylindria bacterium]
MTVQRADLAAEWRAALALARKELRIARRYPLNLANEVLQPIYQFLLPSLLLGATFLVGGRAIGLEASTGTSDLAGYLFLGMIVGGLAGTAFWEIAFGFKREMDAGTLEPAWLTPTRPETMVIGRAIGGLAIGGSASVVLIAIGWVVFGASFSAGTWLALPALGVAALSMIGIGYLVSAAVLRMREPNFFVDATNFLFAMASGVAFPVMVLPDLVRWVAFLLPTTYALDILRVHALGTRPIAPEPIEWLALVGTSLLACGVGVAAFRRTEHRMRVQGTLGQH